MADTRIPGLPFPILPLEEGAPGLPAPVSSAIAANRERAKGQTNVAVTFANSVSEQEVEQTLHWKERNAFMTRKTTIS